MNNRLEKLFNLKNEKDQKIIENLVGLAYSRKKNFNSRKKFILVIMSFFSNPNTYECDLSISEIMKITKIKTKKTVLNALAFLEKGNYIIDTKKRTEETNSTIIYKINDDSLLS